MRVAFAVAILVAVVFAGCAGVDETPAAADPEAAPTKPVVDLMPFNGTITAFGDADLTPITGGGQGIWLDNDILYWSNGADLVTADVSDPLDIQEIGLLEDIGARDVDVMRWNNLTLAVLAGSGLGLHVVDATDPTNLTLLSTIDMPSAGVHNVAVVHGTPYVYSSGASGQTKRIDVADLTDPFNPTVSFFAIPAILGGIPVESDGCHDITVRYDLGRAYCAGGGGTYTGAGGETFIWDISEDPANPRWISMLDDARIKYHHQAMVNDAGTILIVDDEHIVANNCVAVNTPLPGALDPQIPTGAAWVWDISDEENPVMRSIVQNPQTLSTGEIPTPNVNCGSHFGDIIKGQDAFVMGWYTGGTLLVSFTDPDNPEILDTSPPDGSHWDARYWNGRIYHAGTDLLVTPLI